MLCSSILLGYRHTINNATFTKHTTNLIKNNIYNVITCRRYISSSSRRPSPSSPSSPPKHSSSSSSKSSSFSSHSPPNSKNTQQVINNTKNSKASKHSKPTKDSKNSKPTKYSESSKTSKTSQTTKSKSSQTTKSSSSSSHQLDPERFLTIPTTQQDDLPEYATWFFAHMCKFEKSCSSMENLHTSPLPQVAFVGRSNVGKSSLLNSLISSTNKKIARVSATPGCTQLINFYCLFERMMLVDLPGYGYAKVPLSVKRSWLDFMLEYISKSEHLKRIFVLIDSRHGLLQADLEFIEQLEEYKKPFQIVLTKVDKPKGGKKIVENVIEELKKYQWCIPGVILTSSLRKVGMTELKTSCLVATELAKERMKRYLEKKQDKELMSQLDRL